MAHRTVIIYAVIHDGAIRSTIVCEHVGQRPSTRSSKLRQHGKGMDRRELAAERDSPRPGGMRADESGENYNRVGGGAVRGNGAGDQNNRELSSPLQ